MLFLALSKKGLKNYFYQVNYIFLLFIPPFAPELNLSEKIWWKMKRAFTGKLRKTLNNVIPILIIK